MYVRHGFHVAGVVVNTNADIQQQAMSRFFFGSPEITAMAADSGVDLLALHSYWAIAEARWVFSLRAFFLNEPDIDLITFLFLPIFNPN